MSTTRKPNVTPVQLPAVHPFVAVDIPWLLRGAAEAHGPRLFLTWEPFEGSPQSWTYAEAWREMTRLASGLAERGVTPGDAVLIHLDNSPESIFLWLACSLVGAIAVTTNARAAGEELAYFAEKAKAVGVITQPAFADLVRQHLPSIGWSIIVEPGQGGAVLGSDAPLPERAADPAHPFSIQFTSGTTSRPKAVVWTQANALWGAMINARHFGLRDDDITLIHAPMFHTMAQAWQMLSAIWVGAAVVLQPKFSASRFWEVTVRNGVTWTTAGSFAAVALGDAPPAEGHKLRFTIHDFRQAPANHMWGLRTFAAHGMTELITHSMYADPYSPIDERSIGRPSPEYELRIVDDAGEPVAPGEQGELLVKGVRGLSIFSEYLDDPEATASSFTSDGFFKTGDGVKLREDGGIVFVERLKDMLKVGGENVAASEIETIARGVAGVKEVAVVAQPHGFLQEVPYAFIIPHPDAPADLGDQVIAACKKSLADFKVPRGARVVDDFPRSMGGAKVVKAALRQILKDEVGA